jgi:hypothetical protein
MWVGSILRLRGRGLSDLWMMSTPAGKCDFFYERWEHGNEWERVMVKATDCARISKKFLEQERADTFEREYRCAFMDGADQGVRARITRLPIARASTFSRRTVRW